jgi:ferredoxin
MVQVTFLSPKMRDKLTVDVEAGDGRTLLSVMREFEVPGLCRCEEGQCGTCAVKVVPRRDKGAAKSVTLSAREKRALLKRGKISNWQYGEAVLADMPPLWRLACQYMVRDEAILVAF